MLLLGAGGAYAWAHLNGRESTDNAQIDGHIVPVASKIYGTVSEVLVHDNQRVKAGDVIVRIDARDYQARVDQAKAALTTPKARLVQPAPACRLRAIQRPAELLRRSHSFAAPKPTSQSAERISACLLCGTRRRTGQCRGRASASERAQSDLNRMRPLADKEEISKLQFDSYVAAARVAESQWRQRASNCKPRVRHRDPSGIARRRTGASAAGHAGVQSSRANQGQVNVRAAEASSAVAGIGQAKADLETAPLQLGYTESWRRWTAWSPVSPSKSARSSSRAKGCHDRGSFGRRLGDAEL